MTNPYVNLSHVAKTTLHEGWLEYKNFHEYKWRKSWLVLQGNSLSFFAFPNTTEQSPGATLTIEGDFKFVKKDRGSEKAGYKFELHTNKSITKFKSCKFSERELWRAYLEGVATGQVSDSIDLPPEILVQIRLLLQAQNNCTNPRLSLGSSISSVPEIPLDSDGLYYSNDAVSADSGCVDDFYLEPAHSHLLNYVFFNDPYKKELPSWFFQNCSREMAEEMLINGFQYGNTLMRKGSSNSSNLVISKKMEVRMNEFSHYVIDIHPEGYKLKVENPHQPMKSLTDIMNFFVQTSGALTTTPMTCNTLHKLGVSPDHDYNPVIIPNPPTPRPAQTQHDIAKSWSKNRSQSIPNLTPLADLRAAEARRLSSVSFEAQLPPPPPSSMSRQMIPNDILPPPPPPLSNPPQLPLTNKSRVNTPLPPPPPPLSNAPPLPENHPTIKKSQLGSTLSLATLPSESNASVTKTMQSGSTLSLAAQFESTATVTTPKRRSPPVAPRPVKRLDSESQPSGKKIGEIHQDKTQPKPIPKGDNCEVIYAQIRKKKPPLQPSKSVPLSYENWETSNVESDSDKPKNRLSSLNDAKLTYAEINPEPYVMYQDFKTSYNALQTKDLEDRITSTPSQQAKEYDENMISSYGLYELSQSVFKVQSPVRIHFNFNVDEDTSTDKEVFQVVNFYTEDSAVQNSVNNNSNSTGSSEIYEPICDNYISKRPNSDSRLVNISNETSKDNNGNIKLQSKFQQDENEYETIHSFQSKNKTLPIPKVRTVKGISSPGQIYYDPVEWKNKVNRPRIPSPKPRRRTNSLTWKSEKVLYDSASKRSSTLNALDDLKSEFLLSDDKSYTYDEVVLNVVPSEGEDKAVANYIDVIANYEDIRAAKISQKQVASRKHSAPAEDFKKKLEMMFGDSKSKTLPNIRSAKRALPDKPDLKSIVTSSTANQIATDDVYDSLDGYQNTESIKNSMNNK